MKKLFTTLTLVLALSPIVFAQSKGKTEFDVTLGYNSSTVSTSNLNADYKGGFNVGAGIEQYFSESWGIKAKVLYDEKGWANGYYTTSGGLNVTTDYALNYVTIPVMADWHFGRTRNWYLNFGPYVSFLTSAKTSANNQDVKSYFNSTDGGLDVGLGVKFPAGETTKFFIEINGQGGIVDIGNGNFGSSITNSVSALNIGLNF